MNVLFFLLSLALLSVGFIAGMAFAMIFTRSQIKDLEQKNRKLHRDNFELRRRKKDTVEIIYPKREPDSYFDLF